MKKEDEPFELISNDEALDITKKNEEKRIIKLVSNKTLMIIGVVLLVLVVSVINNYMRYKQEEKATMDVIYENLEKSMSEEDIMQIMELTSKAVQLLPKDEQKKLIELQTLFGEKGYSALTANETQLMQELNNKAFNLLPEDDRMKLDALMKRMYDSMTK